MIKFREVTKKFGKITALEKVSFEVSPGEFVFITGPSGAGKTTVVRLILKEIEPTEGKIIVNGQDLSKLPSKKLHQYRRGIGVVFQDFKLIPDRTLFENVALPLEVLGKKRQEIEKKVMKNLDLVDLAERANLFPAQLAGGELQRACLARAVAYEPKILMADEPTGNLDPTSSWQIMKLFKKVNKQGTTFLMATHNVDIVDSVRARVIKLRQGRLLKDEEKGKYEVV